MMFQLFQWWFCLAFPPTDDGGSYPVVINADCFVEEPVGQPFEGIFVQYQNSIIKCGLRTNQKS